MLSKRGISAFVVGLFCLITAPTNVRSQAANSYQRPVQWTLTPATCSKLDPGLIVTGDGRQHFVVDIRKSSNGEIMSIKSNAHGTAFDNFGTQYSWSYVNHLEFTLDDNRGQFTDKFILVSHGGGPDLQVFLRYEIIVDPNHPPEEIPFFATLVSGVARRDEIGCDPI